MGLGSALGSFIRPVAPGLPGAINPLTFIGSGMATGNMGQAMGQMASIREAQQSLGMQQSRLDMLRQEQARRAAAEQRQAQQRKLMQQIALGLLPKRPVEAMGPPTAEGEAPTRMEHTPEQTVMALAMPEAITKAAFNYMPIEGGKGGFFHPLTGQVVAAPASRETPAEFGDVAKVRGEYTKASQPWRESQRAFERIMATEPTGPGDIALLTSYMKVLDPGSTVREGEFATAEQAGGAPDWVRNLYNRLLTGERLNEEQRQQFKSQAASFIEGRRAEQAKTQEQFSYWARQRGMDLREAVPDYLGTYAPENWRETMGVPVWEPTSAPTMPSALSPAPDPSVIDEAMRKYGGPPNLGQRYGLQR